jgi:group I intron endonuclease
MTNLQTIEPRVVVYKAVNLVNGHSYIGYTARGLRKREAAHRNVARGGGTKYRLHRALRKYGDENFEFTVMADFQDDEELAKAYECEAIAAYKPEYNMSYGGEGGTLVEESRKKIGDANRGRKMPPSHGVKRRAYMLGRKHSPEAREKIRLASIGRPSPLKGVPPSAETRAKLSAANKGKVPWTKGKKHSEETKAKIRAQRWNHTPESLERISAARRAVWKEKREQLLPAIREAAKAGQAARRLPVQCLDDGKVFDGCADADRFYGYRIGLVSRIVNGTVPNKTGKTFVRYGAPK